MKVEEIMTRDIRSCKEQDSINKAAQIMWERDCGIVPVVDEASRVVGVVTDRDICMAAYTQGRSLSEISVTSASAKGVYSCRSDDALELAEKTMRENQVRRLPVTNKDGMLVGMLSLSDLVRHLHLVESKPGALGPQGIALTFEAVSRPRGKGAPKAKAKRGDNLVMTAD